MIETKEEYEETLDFLKINRFAYDEANEIDDLIEALREVARAGDNLGGYGDPGGGFLIETDDLGRLTEALDALPDWIIR